MIVKEIESHIETKKVKDVEVGEVFTLGDSLDQEAFAGYKAKTWLMVIDEMQKQKHIVHLESGTMYSLNKSHTTALENLTCIVRKAVLEVKK